MTIKFIFFALFSISFSAVAQSGYWGWAKTGLDMGVTVANSIATDSMGNVYVTGSYETQLFLGGSTLISSGLSDVFIAKYSENGQLLWEKNIGGTGNDKGAGIAVDGQGNVLVAGIFENSADISGAQVISRGGSDIFIAKYNANGTLDWVRQAGSIYDESLTDILVNSQGDIYIGGLYAESNLNPKPEDISCYFNGDSIVSERSSRIYLAKYNSGGDVLWARSMGGFGGNDQLKSMCFDGFGNINIGGWFSSYFEIGHLQLITKSSGWVAGELFVAKLNHDGYPIWANMIWGNNIVGGGKGGAQPGMLGGGAIAADKDGNVIVTGRFIGCDIMFPPYQLNGNGSFMAKYAANGALAWVKGNDWYNNYSVEGLTCNNLGEVYVTGSVGNPGIKIGNDVLEALVWRNIFIGKYDADGNGIWGTVVRGDGFDTPRSILAPGDNLLYIAGAYRSSELNFGADKISSYLNNTASDMFIASYRSFPTGLSNQPDILSINIYPNPFTDVLIINGLPGDVTLIITDIIGREMVRKSVGHTNATLELGHLPNAVYYIIAMDNHGHIVSKNLVVKN